MPHGTGVTLMLTSRPFHTINISKTVRHFWGKNEPSACCLALSSGNSAQFKETRCFVSPLSSTLANSRLWRHFHSAARGSSRKSTSNHLARVEFSKREFFPSVSLACRNALCGLCAKQSARARTNTLTDFFPRAFVAQEMIC